jgi:D-alanine-D-alanine ligase
MIFYEKIGGIEMKVGVIMGGISSEREVSLNSGEEIIKNLDENKYMIFPIIIDNKIELIEKVQGVDIAFLGLHGQFGEDGTVQSILEALNIPYTGCGVLSSAICMDKDITKRILRDAGISTARWTIVRKGEELDYRIIDAIGYPVVVKPNSGGSSVGTAIIKNSEGIEKAILDSFQYDNEVMVEKFISGEEITCSILDGKLLPTLAIKPKATFFDYTAKYSDGCADEYVIELEEGLKEQVENMALMTYKLLKCSVYARIDMIVENGIPYVLEANTLPGMTKNSLIPKSARAVGISYSNLLDLIIEYSLKERR